MSGRHAAGQRLRFLEHRGRRVAFATVGDGPPLLCDLGRLHHLDVFWRYPPYRRLVESLARDFTVIRFDRPGCGLSDRTEADFTEEAELALFDRLLDVLDLDRVAVLASGSCAAVMIGIAALRPERIERLALFAPWAHGAPRSLRSSDALDRLLRTQSQLAYDLVMNRIGPVSGCTVAAVQWLFGAYRQACSAHVMADCIRQWTRLDVRPVLGRVRCPAMVLQRRGDRLVAPQEARDVAARIRDAVLLPLDGGECVPWEGSAEALLGPLRRFLADVAAPGGAGTVLTAREHEVAGLVAAGMTNAEIAGRLGIGPRTVESHLERVRAKLGLVSRSDLAAWTVRSRGQQRRQ